MAIWQLFRSINYKSKKRIGRGIGSGKGKTSTRGTKGQTSRTGYKIPRLFEGGQTNAIARMPKSKGFNSSQDKKISISLAQLKNVPSGTRITPEYLVKNNYIKSSNHRIKIVNSLTAPQNLNFSRVSITKSVAIKYGINEHN